jgi:hypothetical protein
MKAASFISVQVRLHLLLGQVRGAEAGQGRLADQGDAN